MFKTTNLFIKVWLNNTYNLSLISGAYYDLVFFIQEILRLKTAKFWISRGGGCQMRNERFHIFHVLFWGHSPCIKKKGTVQLKE